MPGIFISYRRRDTKGFAGALARALIERIGADQVFLDTEAIEGGTEFPAVLERAIQTSDVMLALIGPGWLDSKDADGRRRLDDANDFVRQELLLALQRDVRVIPVLVDGTQMPVEHQLPSDLQPLAKRHALELTNTHWEEDVARIVDHAREGMYALGVARAATARPARDFMALPPMTPGMRVLVCIWVAIGLTFGLTFGLDGVAQWRFQARALRSDAEVVNLLREESHLFRPVLQFDTVDGRTIRVKASAASDPPAYAIGQHVSVLYDPATPEVAQIDSFWAWTIVLLGVGTLPGAIGGIVLGRYWARRRRIRWLMRHGRPIVTAYHAVEVARWVAVGDKHPFRVVTEWRNPVSKELVRFRSNPVWEDPTDKASRRMITVVVDPDNFRRYAMDLSFLQLHQERQWTVAGEVQKAVRTFWAFTKILLLCLASIVLAELLPPVQALQRFTSDNEAPLLWITGILGMFGFLLFLGTGLVAAAKGLLVAKAGELSDEFTWAELRQAWRQRQLWRGQWRMRMILMAGAMLMSLGLLGFVFVIVPASGKLLTAGLLSYYAVWWCFKRGDR